ncbi:LOW QUALITY PROTEIN: G protein-activated inward rectifier potassium channel 2-like [Pecten maximus]|uniref:LOW QUALITY PROTEIN: G protein-activated inward rectifier potassium channel 2-like n=1 Tax=Pecten maximus TaxID=6579 RepID=UPI0014582763|nr:LOW QUALITY PROTEIN: G protein-activated inward rectifier potassium channel 2-like [Pecten maximus]
MTTNGQEFGTFYMYKDAKPTVESRYPILQYFKRKLKIGQFDPEDKRRALVKKSGHYRVKYTGLKEFRGLFLRDLYITLIDLQWRYVLAIVFNMYLITFFFFGVCWYWIMASNGDFDHLNDPNWKPCLSGVYTFAGTLIFSIETQTTIGYGYAYLNSECSSTLVLLFIQITCGILMENLLLGFVFVKFAQPKRRQKTIVFSKTAVVNQENGNFCLQIRLGDMRQSHLLDARVHGVLAKKHVTTEGVQYPLYLHDMEFQAQAMGKKIVLMWPLVLSHKITSESPFWNIKPADLMSDLYELIIYVEGTIESTGEYCQARTSYLPSEILWGHRFDRLEEFDSGNGRWEVDFEGFHDVIYTTNIRQSAKELYDLKFNPTKDNTKDDTTSPRSKTPSPPLSVSLHTIPYDSPPTSENFKFNDATDTTIGSEETSIMPEMTSEDEMENYFHSTQTISGNEDESGSTDGTTLDTNPKEETEIHSDLGNGNLGDIQEEEESDNLARYKYADADDDDDDDEKSDDEYLSS